MNALAPVRGFVEFRKCYPEHLRYIVAQDAQSDEQAAVLASYADSVTGSRVALSAWFENRCLGAAGIIDVYEGRAFAWALMSKYARPHLLTITRHIKFVLGHQDIRRIEMVVKADFKQGNTWARMLGFECETPNGMKAYFNDGSAALQYVRVNDASLRRA